jgi:hypothetical protein
MTNLDVAVQQANALSPDMYLGYLSWYSIAGVKVDHNDFTRSLLINGLDDHLPPVPRTPDIFKRVTTEAQVRRVPTSEEGVLENYLVRQVGKDNEAIWRRIVVERVDTGGRKLGYVEAYEFKFVRATSVIEVTAIAPEGTYPTADEMVQRVRTEFAAWANGLNSYSVREHIRSIFIRMHATAVRPAGGVYFVSSRHGDKMAALERLVAALPGNCAFHYLPLVDNTKQREMLKAAFEDESIGAIDALLMEIKDIRGSNKKITRDKFASYAEQYNTLRDKVLDYSNLLNDALDATGSRLEIFSESISELMNNVRA